MILYCDKYYTIADYRTLLLHYISFFFQKKVNIDIWKNFLSQVNVQVRIFLHILRILLFYKCITEAIQSSNSSQYFVVSSLSSRLFGRE